MTQCDAINVAAYIICHCNDNKLPINNPRLQKILYFIQAEFLVKKEGKRKMKQINNYICLVDYYRRPSLFRNTRGCYRVGAKTPEEEKRLLRDKIKFGSILVYGECDAERDKQNGAFVPYKTVLKKNLILKIALMKMETLFV